MANRISDKLPKPEGVAPVVPRALGPHRDVSIDSVGVVGAGTMGIGITLAFLIAGIPVKLHDAEPAVLSAAAAKIRTTFERMTSKGRFSCSEAAEFLTALEPVLDLNNFESCDLIVEAVFESLDVKRGVFRRLDSICKPGAILATNTSTLDVETIAEATSRPGSVIGLHFFSPAHVMPLVEIVRTRYLGSGLEAAAMALATRLGKAGVVVGNCYGFAGNRVIEGFGREANYLLLEGVSPERIDRALVNFGFSMGPFLVADLVGLDVPFRARQENSQALPGDPSYYRMADVLVERNHLGQKTGRGYYLYESGIPPVVDPLVAELARDEARRLGIPQRNSTESEIVDRCILPIINEGARVLQEGIVDSAGELDSILTLGYGFPRASGGPMRYADGRGLQTVLAAVRRLEATYGAYWKPATSLEELAATGGQFGVFFSGLEKTPATG